MKKNVTRMIALALIALMCFTLLPMAAFAEVPETGAPQVELVRHIINGQPGEIRGLTADMEYTNAETGWAWADAPANGVLQVAQSCTTYFCYRGFENDETRKSSVTIYDYFTVTPSAGEGGSVSPSDVQVLLMSNSGPDGSATFSFTPNEGYELEDVTVDGVSVGAQSSYTVSNVTAEMTISASFKQAPPPAPTTYTVSFDAKGGTPEPPQQTVTAGQAVTLPTGLSRESYAFAGWSETDGGPAITSQSYTPTQSRTLYARWRDLTVYTLHFDANGGGGQMSSLTKTELQGNSFTVPECAFTQPANKGPFVCWNTSANGGGVSYQPGNTILIENAEIPTQRLYAIWAEGSGSGSGNNDNITVTVTHNSYGSVKYGNNTVVSGTPVTVPRGTSFILQPNEGARTKTVRKDNVQVGAASGYSFQANGTLEVSFEQGLPASSFGTSVSAPSAPVTVGNSKKYTYNISLTLNGGPATDVYPTGPVSFLIPYPDGLSATSHTYTLKHVPDNQTISVTAAANGIQASSASFSAFDLTATPRAANDNLSVVVSPTSAHPGTVLSATVTPSTASVSYQWMVNSQSIAGETNSSYTVRDADVGKQIICIVNAGSNMAGSNVVTPAATGSSAANRAAPTTPAVERHILDGQPGIIKGLDTTMEYLPPYSITWIPCTGATLTVADGWEGTYNFRYRRVGTTPESSAVAVTIRSYYTVTAAVNLGHGTVSPDTSKYPAEISKGNTKAISLVEKGGTYHVKIYPARRYYIYSIVDEGVLKGRKDYYTITNVKNPHFIIVNFAENYSPRTADDSNIPLWTTLCCASLAGFGAVWMILRRRKEE